MMAKEPGPNIVEKVVTRQRLRKKRKWETCDKLRDMLRRHGYELEDTPLGTRIIWRGEKNEQQFFFVRDEEAWG